MQEELRNSRQSASTSFDSMDQKTDRLFEALSAVLKNMQEMVTGAVRNLL